MGQQNTAAVSAYWDLVGQLEDGNHGLMTERDYALVLAAYPESLGDAIDAAKPDIAALTGPGIHDGWCAAYLGSVFKAALFTELSRRLHDDRQEYREDQAEQDRQDIALYGVAAADLMRSGEL